MRARKCAGSIWKVRGSTSTNTGRRAQHQRHFGGRGVGEGGQEHRVARPDAPRPSCAICSASVPELTPRRNAWRRRTPASSLLQLGDFRAEDELAMRQHRIEPAAQVGGDARLLRLEVEERQRPGGIVFMRRAFFERERDPRVKRGRRRRCRRRCARTPAPCAPSSASASRICPPRQADGDLVDGAADDGRVGGARRRHQQARAGRWAPAAPGRGTALRYSFSPGRRPVKRISMSSSGPQARRAGSSGARDRRSSPARPCRARRCRRRAAPPRAAAPTTLACSTSPTASRTVMK